MDTAIAGWLALLLFGIYLLSFSGNVYSSDGLSMLSVTESFVKRGEFNTDQMWTFFRFKGQLAADGESYAKYGYGTSIIAAPFYALALALPGIGLLEIPILASTMAIALSAGLLYSVSRRFDLSRRAAMVTTLLFALGTPAWVYAKEFWSEPFSLVSLWACFYFLLRFRSGGRAGDALIAAAALGVSIAVRLTNAILVPFFVWYAFGDRLREQGARRAALLFLILNVLALLSVAWYNWGRYGNPLETGYRADEVFSNPILFGAFALLASSGKGLLIYVPFLVALPLGAYIFFRRHQRESVLAIGVFLTYLIIFSAWYYWWGGTDWGPRYLVPTLPWLVLLCAPAVALVVDRDSSAKPRFPAWLGVLFGFLCLISLVVELLGVSVSSLSYRLTMMNVSANPEGDANFNPAFSPLIGYWNLLHLKTLNFAWVRPSDSGVAIDWLVVITILLFCALSLTVLWRSFKNNSSSRLGLAIGVVLAIGVSLILLYRLAGRSPLGSAAGYREILAELQKDGRGGDVLIVRDDAVAPLLLDQNRTTMRWYGLSRDPNQWDAQTQALLARLARQYRRVWFALDDSTRVLPDPVGGWLAGSLQQVMKYNYSDGVHLVLFETGVR